MLDYIFSKSLPVNLQSEKTWVAFVINVPAVTVAFVTCILPEENLLWLFALFGFHVSFREVATHFIVTNRPAVYITDIWGEQIIQFEKKPACPDFF